MNKFEKQIKMMILETLLKEEGETLEVKIEAIMIDIDQALYYNDHTSDLPQASLDAIRNNVKDILREVLAGSGETSEAKEKGAPIGGVDASARATTLSPPTTRLEKVKKDLETAVDMAASAGFLDEKYKKHVSKDGIDTSQIIRDRLTERETEVRGELKKLKDLEEQLSNGLEIIDIVMIDQIQELTDEINHREGEKVLRTAWTKRSMSKDPAPRPEFAQEGKK